MDIFKIQSNIMREYEKYISSFLNINNENIRNKVQEEILSGKLWPEPLIQFNPSFEIVCTIDELCDQGILHPDMKNIFKGYDLYKHQVDAIKLGVNGNDFVVTSGTASGKSLTFLGTIFNSILNQEKPERSIKAVIVYPMNALINSQFDEIKIIKEEYKKNTGKDFPISAEQYTGQEDQETRERIKRELPDILLTNYMMLELILTRRSEMGLRNSIYENIRFLVFDELHTYRGRQGSDVGFLIRRIKARAKNEILCIGTSATMISGVSIAEQKGKVAEVASLLFGKRFNSEQIIDETIVRSLPFDEKLVSKETIIKSLEVGIDINKKEDELINHPLSIWLENEIALTEKDGRLQRNKPCPLSFIVNELQSYTGLDKDFCKNQLKRLFLWISKINESKTSQREAYLPFKLHQFISQTGSVYVTLDQGDDQVITLEPGVIVGDSKTGKPLYTVVFSRSSGHPFICVTKDYNKGKLISRVFEETIDDEEDDAMPNVGYLIVGDDIWDPEEDLELLPDAWLRYDKQGGVKVIPKYRNRIPQKIYFDEQGNFSEKEPLQYEGWFMPYRLLFEPTSGTFFEPRTSERTKLASLGSEGRSSSTTILSFLILCELANNGFLYADQKLLSFTDNRQDAALQAGHFNDFLDVVQLRASICRALEKSETGVLDHTNIAHSVFKVLNLEQSNYAAQTATFTGAMRENEDAFKDAIMYRILYDLRRSWRVILPNLEQCALLEIGYKYLEENCRDDNAWNDVPLINQMDSEKRLEVIYQVLDFVRKSYAIHSSEYLTSEARERNRKKIQEKLRAPWRFEEDERIVEPYYVTSEKLKGRRKLYTQSIGLRSALGKYLKTVAREYEINLNTETYGEFIKILMKALCEAGWLRSQKAYTANNEETSIYQLSIDMIEWKIGDGENISPDRVKTRSYKRDLVKIKPNTFFQNLYKIDFGKLKKYRAEDHTGQLTTEDRRQREKYFQNGDLSALYCSPTMELGVNISKLNVVHMRNVPPNPANYVQRGGRAGRSGQSALIFTFCSSFAPHDRHYFNASEDMVVGVVAPPQIDLANEELLSSHLHSIYLSELGTEHIDISIRDILTLDDEKLLIKPDIIANMTPGDRDKEIIKQVFKNMIQDILDRIKRKGWYSESWIDQKIDSTIKDFDMSLERWRNLYRAAQRQLDNAHQIKRSGLYAQNSKEMKEANREEYQAVRQIALLCNTDRTSTVSEFYPYRYLASEGFLPGYNFTRLPVRTFIPRGDSGEYISRPRFIAIREFGPQNIIYYNGSKYQVNQLLIPEVEKNLTRAKICVSSGYCMTDEEFNYEVCPLTNVSIEGAQRKVMVDLLEMSETKTIARERISCEEEERLTHGYMLETYFSVPGGMERIVRAKVKSDEDEFLNVRYIPAAKLIQINAGWRNTQEEGFLLGLISGIWKRNKKKDTSESKEDERRVKLYTTDTADALYIEPIEALALSYEGVVTLQYAMKRAIENLFQIEPNEIDVTLMGDEEMPNIFLYEASEGSLGILMQFVEDPRNFDNLIDEAYRICRYDDEDYKEPASYDDLLSYYNQRHHGFIDRWLIKDALAKLKACHLEILSNPMYHSYDEQYMYLINHYDQGSTTELEFLEYLYANDLRLPDDAQREVPTIYVKPDFFYHPDVWVFCDGTPHDDPEQIEHDKKVREAIINRGEQVIVYHYKDELADLITKRPDIFKKVR